MELNTKHYARRDSATAILRKMGVKKEDYEKYLTGNTAKGFTLTLPMATDPAPDDVVQLSQAVGDANANEALDVGVHPLENTETPERSAEDTAEAHASIRARLNRREAAPPLTKTKKGAKGAKKAAKGAKAQPAKKAAAKPADDGKAPRVSIAGRARELIREGKDNAEVFTVLQAEFQLGDDKKHYPSWYRSQLRRDGEKV